MRSLYSFQRHLDKTVAQCCTTWIVLEQTTLLGPEYLVSPHRCKSDYCEVCRVHNLRALRFTLRQALRHHTWRLVTLTFPDHSRDPLLQLTELYRTFKRFVQRLKYRFPGISYVRTIEIHQRGYPHIHLIVDKYVPVSFLQKAWHDLGGGIVDIRRPVTSLGTKKRVTFREAARYLTEEIEKAAQDPHRLGSIFWQAHCKAITSSRNLSLERGPSPLRYLGQHDTLASAMWHYDWLLYKSVNYGDPVPSIYYGPNSFKIGYALTDRVN